MGDWRQMGHAARRRMGAPSNHFGAAMANDGDDDDDEQGPSDYEVAAKTNPYIKPFILGKKEEK